MKTILKLYGLQKMPVNDFKKHPLTWQPSQVELTRPKYISLAALIERDIEEGRLPSGTRLPPQRLLADYLDINFTTVTRAYDLCRERSLVYGVTGRGTFVSANPGGERYTGKIYDLGAVQGFPSIGAKLIIDAARDVLSRDYITKLFSYSDRDGVSRHRSSGAYWLDKFNVPATQEQIAVFPGVQNALSTILTAIFHTGDTLAVDSFTYSNLIGAANLLHINLIAIENDKYGMMPKSLSSVLKKQKIKGVFLMPNCANPTTITMPLERKKEIAEIARRNNVIIIEDDASLSAEASTSFFSLFPENTFYLTGNTRFISPGLRVAFVAYPNRFKEKFLNALHKLTIKGSALDAEIMSELILNGSAEKILLQKINRAKTMNKTFDAIFPNLARESEDMPFFRTIPLPCSNATGQEIEQTLLKKNIRICHSYRFAATRNPKMSFLRVSLSSVDSKAKLANALKTIKDFLNDYL